MPQEQTSCQKAVQEVGGVAAPPGAYVPQCDEHGEYKPLQFHASSGESWCVNRHGTEIPGTRTPVDKPIPDCQQFTGKSSGYATWFTAGGAIRIAHYDVIDDVITRKP